MLSNGMLCLAWNASQSIACGLCHDLEEMTRLVSGKRTGVSQFNDEITKFFNPLDFLAFPCGEENLERGV
ncbi:MAG: hypothetical protein ABJZ69_05095 [Hyphomicrobiales bacterium]